MSAHPARHIGQYIDGGDWRGYWRTSISEASDGHIIVRGYPVEEIIEQLTATEANWLLLRGELPTRKEAELFDVCLRCGLDQQFISSAACATRFAASASGSPSSAIAAGLLATGLVTGSPRPTMEMLLEARERGARDGQPPEALAAGVVAAYRERGELVPGFGHPIHRASPEPRAEALRRAIKARDGWGEHGQTIEAIHAALERALGRTIHINLAGMLAAVYCDLGFDPLEAEGISAVDYGWALIAHAVEEIRDGVPLRIITDALGAAYTGPGERHIPAGRA